MIRNDDEDDYDDYDYDYDEANRCGNETQWNDTTNYLDESITHLKQTINTESQNNVHGVQPTKKDIGTDDQSKVKSHKCCDSCKINPNSKMKYEMIRCSVCMTWYHEKCVGVAKDEPIGL